MIQHHCTYWLKVTNSLPNILWLVVQARCYVGISLTPELTQLTWYKLEQSLSTLLSKCGSLLKSGCSFSEQLNKDFFLDYSSEGMCTERHAWGSVLFPSQILNSASGLLCLCVACNNTLLLHGSLICCQTFGDISSQCMWHSWLAVHMSRGTICLGHKTQCYCTRVPTALCMAMYVNTLSYDCRNIRIRGAHAITKGWTLSPESSMQVWFSDCRLNAVRWLHCSTNMSWHATFNAVKFYILLHTKALYCSTLNPQ